LDKFASSGTEKQEQSSHISLEKGVSKFVKAKTANNQGKNREY